VGFEALLNALDGMTEEFARTRPGPGGWPALECAAHIAISEDFFFSQITHAKPSTQPLGNREREAAILAHRADRTKTFDSTDVAKPAGSFSNLAEAVQHFLRSREQTVRFVETCNQDLRAMQITHPPFARSTAMKPYY
jgi:DinB superfamily